METFLLSPSHTTKSNFLFYTKKSFALNKRCSHGDQNLIMVIQNLKIQNLFCSFDFLQVQQKKIFLQ